MNPAHDHELISYPHSSLTWQSEGLSVTAEVEVSNTGAQIADHTLHMTVTEVTPWYVQLL